MTTESVGQHVPENEKKSSLKKLYLVMYNSSLVISWSLVLLKAAIHVSEKKTFHGLYREVEYWLKIAQTAALLEIIHVMVGLVKSSVIVTIPQVGSRIYTLWAIVDFIVMKNDMTQDTIGFPCLLFAWTITEIIRYTFYTNTLLDNMTYGLQWCRYTFFIVLYPLGVAGEIICILAAIPLAKQSGCLSFTMPNKLNISFDFVYFCYFALLFYGPGFYFLYTHMLKLRQKVLASKDKTS